MDSCWLHWQGRGQMQAVKLRQAGKELVHAFRRSSTSTVQRTQASANGHEGCGQLISTLREVVALEKVTGWRDAIRINRDRGFSAQFSDILVTSLQQLEYIAPVHLRPEVSEVIQASKSYQTSSPTHRQAVIQQVDQLLSNVKRSSGHSPRGMPAVPLHPPASRPRSTQVGGNTPTAQEAYRPQFGGGGRFADGPAQPKSQEPHGMGPALPPRSMQYHKAQQMALHKRMQAHHRVQRPAAPSSSSAPVAPPRPPSWAQPPAPSPYFPRPWANADDGRAQHSARVQHPSVISPPDGPPPDRTLISNAIDPALQSSPAEKLLDERRNSGQQTSTSASASPQANDASGQGQQILLTGRTDYNLYSRDTQGPRSGYDQVHLDIHPCCHSTKYKLIAFDTETDGCSPPREFNLQKLVEIAAHGLESGQGMQTLVNNEGPINAKVVDLHHVTEEMVSNPQVPKIREACLAFLDFVQSQVKDAPGCRPVLCAHNLVNFDWPVMAHNFSAVGLQWPDDWLFFDSLTAIRELKGENKENALGKLIAHYGVVATGVLHHAMTDVRGLAEVLPHMMQGYGIKSLDDLLHRRWNGNVFGTMKSLREKAEFSQAAAHGRIMKVERQKQRRTEGQRKDAALLPTSSDPIQMVERQMLSKSTIIGPAEKLLNQQAWKGAKLEQGVTASWVDILSRPILDRDFLDDDFRTSRLLTDKQIKSLTKLDNITSPLDILEHYPRDYQYCFPRMYDNEYASVVGTIVKHTSFNNYKFQKTELVVRVDPHACAELDPLSADIPPDMAPQSVTYSRMIPTFRGKLTNARPRAAEGSQIVMQGKLTKQGPGYWTIDQNANLIYDWNASDECKPPLILPVYAKRDAMEPRDWKSVINKILKHLDSRRLSQDYWEPLPDNIIQQFELKPWLEAVKEMHNPTTEADLEEAIRRLAFEDLFLAQISILLRRQMFRSSQGSKGKARALINKSALVSSAKRKLSYKLTAAQDKVLAEILEDMNTPAPMLRLLQGDVGCGKTIVAFLAMLAAVNSGFQGAIMAPTEVLVEQHYNRLAEVIATLPAKQRPVLVKLAGTSSKPGRVRNEILQGLADGSTALVVGTKALCSEGVVFKKLGLVIIDEQHKFGVEQRAKLQAKARPLPHVLYMTATPIPRTLALVNHGDMTFSAIDELPPGRQQVETVVIEDSGHATDEMFEEVRKEIQEGGRVFIILCFIEESKSKALEEVKAATKEYEYLLENKILGKDTKLGLLHGSLKSEEKEKVMQAFIRGEIQALVSTTLVEVGLDVKEASMMIINNAERFGLAQLHQLRGRVGRGQRKSKCFLVHSDTEEKGRASHRRLSLMASEHNGLRLAEEDLVFRGQGDVTGKQQSGKDIIANLKVAKLPQHRVLMDEAREAAAKLILEAGLDSNNWPAGLLIALSKQRFPKLDHSILPKA